MIPSFVRFAGRLLGILLLMQCVEVAAFFLDREEGVSRLYWVPLSYALVAWAGYETVKRFPLIWGTLVGVLLAGATNVLSWLAGGFVYDGRLGFPPEADPMLVATGGLLGAVVGGIIGTGAGLIARRRRRVRSRHEALGKLGHETFDENDEADMEPQRR